MFDDDELYTSAEAAFKRGKGTEDTAAVLMKKFRLGESLEGYDFGEVKNAIKNVEAAALNLRHINRVAGMPGGINRRMFDEASQLVADAKNKLTDILDDIEDRRNA
jgi:hypothetical protein